MGHGTVTVIYLGTALHIVGWCQQNHIKEVESRSTSSEKNTSTCGQRNQSDSRTISWRTSEETEIDRDMWQKCNVLEKMCRMETSFLISLTLLLNNNDWPPRKFHSQLRVILTHTPALPIHDGRNYQEFKRKRETHAHNQQRDSD